MEVPTFVLSVEALAFVVTVLAPLLVARDGVFAPLAVVCRLSAAVLTPGLEGVPWSVPLPPTTAPSICSLALYMSEVEEFSANSEALESVVPLTKASGVFLSGWVVSSVVGRRPRSAS